MNTKMKGAFTAVMSFDKATVNLSNSGVKLGEFLPEDKVSTEKILESFSFFGSGNDANKYFQDVNNKNIVPSPEDFIRVPFRLISETIVGAGTWKATDFSEANLKDSVSMLDGQPIFFDHDQDIMNWVGIVTEPSWSESRVDDNGIKIPAGIDAVLLVDAKTNPKIARGLLMGAIQSNSVTVVFDWVMSHPSLTRDEFECKIGEVVDNKMVARKATKIYGYYETSLCWLGADPFAKIYDESGNLRNVDTIAVFEDEPEEVKTTYSKQGCYSAACGYTKEVFRSMISNNKKKQTRFNNDNMDKELQDMLCTLLGLAKGTELKASNFKDVVLLSSSEKSSLDASKAIHAKVVSMAKESLGKDCDNVDEFLDSHSFIGTPEKESLEAAQSTVNSVKVELGLKEDDTIELVVSTAKTLSADAVVGKEALSAKREETKRLYMLSVDNKADEAVISLIAKADNAALDGLLKSYTKGATASFTGVCKDCGSHNFTFRSSFIKEPEENDEESGSNAMSYNDIYESESKSKFNIAKN